MMTHNDPQTRSCMCSVLCPFQVIWRVFFLYHMCWGNAWNPYSSRRTLLTLPNEETSVQHRFHQYFSVCPVWLELLDLLVCLQAKQTLHMWQNFSLEMTSPLNSNCSAVMFRALPEKKGHCHSQGFVQCTPQKEGKKVNIENWGDIQSYKRHNKRKTSRKWLYNGAKSRLLGPEHLFRQPPQLVTDLISK